MILHLDADAFFASCEQATNPAYASKPVVVGQERGIATAFSYDAKNQGISRGMLVSEVKKICPEAVIVSGNYSKYKKFSQRIYKIMRTIAGTVEEYSIDEAFSDLSGLESIKKAKKIKQEIQQKLGIIVSVGLAPTKTLAKVASSTNKPDGFTCIKQKDIKDFLQDLEITEIWGIGSQIGKKMKSMSTYTALDFIDKKEQFIRHNFNINTVRTFLELNGRQMYKVQDGSIAKYKSISSSKTFKPASSDKEKVYSQLVKNVEKACKRIRKQDLVSDKVKIFLKSQQFKKYKKEVNLSLPSAYPIDILSKIKSTFGKLFNSKYKYRSTGIVFRNLKKATPEQLGLLKSYRKQKNFNKIYSAVDEIEKKYGEETMFLASSMESRDNKKEGFSVDKNKTLDIPMMGEVN